MNEPNRLVATYVQCPAPFEDCRPGACDCDGVYDGAKHCGDDPAAARFYFIQGMKRMLGTDDHRQRLQPRPEAGQ